MGWIGLQALVLDPSGQIGIQYDRVQDSGPDLMGSRCCVTPTGNCDVYTET